MHARLLSTAASEWDAALSRMSHDFYHLPAYAAHQASWEAGRAQALYVRDGQAELLVPLVIRPIPGGGYDARTPYGYAGPVATDAADQAFLAAALQAGTRFLADEGLVSLFIRLHPLLNADMQEDVGVIVTHGETVVIDLTLDEDVHWQQTRGGHRSEINAARRRGHRVVFDTDRQHQKDFTRLYEETMDRLDASPEYRFDDAYLEGLAHALEDRLHLVAVEIDGETAAAALFVETCGTVEYHLSATDERFRKESPTKLMLHEVRSWARSRGHRWLHLGGGLGGADDALLRFKAGFSPGRRLLRTLRVVLSPSEYQRLQCSGDASPTLEDLSGYFPAYRDTR